MKNIRFYLFFQKAENNVILYGYIHLKHRMIEGT